MGAAANVVGIGFVFGAALLAFASPTEAQLSSAPPLRLGVATHDGRIMPITDQAIIPLTVTYSCDAFRSTSPAPVAIEFRTSTADPWVQAQVSPGTLLVENGLQACPLGETRSGTVDLSVVLTREAPAYREAAIVVRAAAEVDGDEFEAENETTVVPDFYSVIHATTPFSVVKMGPGDERSVLIEVENLGNGPALVRLAARGPLKEFDARFDNETIIDSPYDTTANRTTGRFEVHLRAPREGLYTNDVTNLDFTAQAYSASEPDVVGDKGQVSIQVRVQGVFGGDDRALPAPELAWLALAFAALLGRRR